MSRERPARLALASALLLSSACVGCGGSEPAGTSAPAVAPELKAPPKVGSPEFNEVMEKTKKAQASPP